MVNPNIKTYEELINISPEEQASRYREMVLASFCHLVDGLDLLGELHPRRTLNIKRRVDGVETWFEGDWLTTVMDARNGKKISEYHQLPTKGSEG